MRKRLMLSAIVYPMANAVLFGFGAILVATLARYEAGTWLPIVIGLSFALAAPLSWFIAPTLSLRMAHAKGYHFRDVEPVHSSVLR